MRSSVGDALGASGAVHHDVHLAERLDAGGEQRLQRRTAGDVGGDAQRAAAELLDFGGCLVDEIGPPRGGHDVGAGLGEPVREGTADAGRAADDHGRIGR